MLIYRPNPLMQLLGIVIAAVAAGVIQRRRISRREH